MWLYVSLFCNIKKKRTVSLKITNFCVIYSLTRKFLFLHDKFCSVTTEGQNRSNTAVFCNIIAAHRNVTNESHKTWMLDYTRTCRYTNINLIVTLIHRTTA
jgi:hypothetical protein